MAGMAIEVLRHEVLGDIYLPSLGVKWIVVCEFTVIMANMDFTKGPIHTSQLTRPS